MACVAAFIVALLAVVAFTCRGQPLDLGAPENDGGDIQLLWGTGSRFSLGSERVTWQGDYDHVAQIGYNVHADVRSDCSAFLQIESAFKNPSSYDTEFHFNFRPPGGSDLYRWLQVNCSWGAPYSTDGWMPGENWVAFGATRFSISGDHADTFSQRFYFTAAYGEPDLLIQPLANEKDARIRVARVGATEWLQLGSGGGGNLLGGINNLVTLDTVGPNVAQTRAISLRKSMDGGQTYSAMVSIVPSADSSRCLFNGVGDDGHSAMQISGDVRIEGSVSTPSSGSNSPGWKLGAVITGTVVASTNEYVEVEIGGRKVKLLIAQ